MKVTLYKEDIRDSGWFYILQELGMIEHSVEFDDVISAPYGEITKAYQHLFSDDYSIEVIVNSINK